MRVPSRLLPALALPLLAVTAAVGACGGDESKPVAARSEERRSGGAPTRRAHERAPSSAAAMWSHARLMRRIAGESLLIGRRRLRIDPATVTCGGEGPGSVRAHVRVWERFRCVQPTFGGAGAAGPDAVFLVQPTGPRSFRVTGQRFVRY